MHARRWRLFAARSGVGDIEVPFVHWRICVSFPASPYSAILLTMKQGTLTRFRGLYLFRGAFCFVNDNAWRSNEQVKASTLTFRETLPLSCAAIPFFGFSNCCSSMACSGGDIGQRIEGLIVVKSKS